MDFDPPSILWSTPEGMHMIDKPEPVNMKQDYPDYFNIPLKEVLYELQQKSTLDKRNTELLLHICTMANVLKFDRSNTVGNFYTAVISTEESISLVRWAFGIFDFNGEQGSGPEHQLACRNAMEILCNRVLINFPNVDFNGDTLIPKVPPPDPFTLETVCNAEVVQVGRNPEGELIYRVTFKGQDKPMFMVEAK